MIEEVRPENPTFYSLLGYNIVHFANMTLLISSGAKCMDIILGIFHWSKLFNVITKQSIFYYLLWILLSTKQPMKPL